MIWRQKAPFLQRALGLLQPTTNLPDWGGITAAATAAEQLRRRQLVRRKHWLAVWGNGDHGRLGLSSTSSQWRPSVCRSLRDQEPIAVACGGAHTLILTDNGRVFATGLNNYGQLGVPFETSQSLEPVEVKGLPDRCVNVSAGYHHSAAISDDGAVYIWGSNLHGQLGLGKKAKSKTCFPQRVDALRGLRIKILALASDHSMALTENGELLSWGSGQSGQLGHGQPNGLFRHLRSASEYYPRIIDSLRNVQVHAVAAGLMHSACIDHLGRLYTFGQGRMCQLGHGNTTDSFEPLVVSNLPPCTGTGCGGYHTGAISRNGDLYMWGSNEYGCLGLGYRHTNQAVFPMKVDGSISRLRVSEVSCGWKHTYALTGNGGLVYTFHRKLIADAPVARLAITSGAISDGQMYAWGWGGSQGTYSTEGHSSGGQLGLGNEFDYNEPTSLLTNGMQTLHISCGFNHTAAILREW